MEALIWCTNNKQNHPWYIQRYISLRAWILSGESNLTFQQLSNNISHIEQQQRLEELQGSSCTSIDGWCTTRSSWYVHFLQPWNCTHSILPSNMSFHQLMNTAPIIPKTQRISTINRMWKPETVKTLAQLYIAQWQKRSSPLEPLRLWWCSNHLTQQTSRDCRFLMGNPFTEIADLLRTNQQTLHYRTSHSLHPEVSFEEISSIACIQRGWKRSPSDSNRKHCWRIQYLIMHLMMLLCSGALS